mgnify:CR=1 FL=1
MGKMGVCSEVNAWVLLQNSPIGYSVLTNHLPFKRKTDALRNALLSIGYALLAKISNMLLLKK